MSAGPTLRVGADNPQEDGCVSIYPCDFHGQRVPGSLSAAYVTAMDGAVRYQRRLRLCSKDLAELVGQYGEHWAHISDDSDSYPSTVCAACGAVPDERGNAWTVFATLFPKGQDRENYIAALHQACAEAYTDRLGLKLEPSR
jgi:hypothetical protein